MKRWIFVFAAMAVAVGWFMIDDFNRIGVLASRDYIQQGSKFGVSIGDSTDVARRHLSERGLTSFKTEYKQSCHGRAFSDDEQVEGWHDTVGERAQFVSYRAKIA